MAARDQASCLPEEPVALYATRQAVLTSGKQALLSDVWIGWLPTAPGRAAAFLILPQLAVIT